MISKRGFSVLVLLAVLLAACSSATSTTAPQSGQQPGAIVAGQPGCTVTVRKPTPGPTEQAPLPPPGEKDWIKGPADAYVTITEYSDFQ